MHWEFLEIAYEALTQHPKSENRELKRKGISVADQMDIFRRDTILATCNKVWILLDSHV